MSSLLIIAGAKGHKFISKIAPIVASEQFQHIYVLGRGPVVYPLLRSCHPPAFCRRHLLLAEGHRWLRALDLLLTRRIEVIMGIYFFPHGILAGLLGRLFHKRVIQNLIGSDLPRALAAAPWRALLQQADVLVTRGAQSKRELVQIGITAGRIYHPPNVFDFRAVPQRTVAAPARYDLIYVGSLVPVKRLDILLIALHQVRQQYGPSVSLAIVGDGPLQTNLHQLACQLGIADQVHFLGWQQNVYEYLLQARVFIMTSEYEGLPMAMIEALACGLPCILPAVSNISSVAPNGYNALLVPPGDVRAYGHAIYRLLNDQQLYQRLARNAAEFRRSKAHEYSLGNVTKIWRQILHSLYTTAP